MALRVTGTVAFGAALGLGAYAGLQVAESPQTEGVVARAGVSDTGGACAEDESLFFSIAFTNAAEAGPMDEVIARSIEESFGRPTSADQVLGKTMVVSEDAESVVVHVDGVVEGGPVQVRLVKVGANYALDSLHRCQPSAEAGG